MKANARALAEREDAGAAETIGAIILFAIFIGTIAILNVSAVPQSGKGAEQSHAADVLDRLNALQSGAESVALPASIGASVSQSIPLAPTQAPGHDFMSFFLATPGTAAGEISFVGDYGSVRLTHNVSGVSISDVGAPGQRFAMGRILFDAHPIFVSPGTDAMEDGAVITTDGATQTLRFAPPVTVKIAGGTTYVTVLTRVLNGTNLDIGGTTAVRASLASEAVAISAPVANNADGLTFTLDTAYGAAWGQYLNSTSTTAGLTLGSGFTTSVLHAKGVGGIDRVIWTVTGLGGAMDIRLTSGLAIFRVGLT